MAKVMAVVAKGFAIAGGALSNKVLAKRLLLIMSFMGEFLNCI
jgi:hypothetical protein